MTHLFSFVSLFVLVLSRNRISHFIRGMEATRSVVVEDCFEGTWMSVKEELVVWPWKLDNKDNMTHAVWSWKLDNKEKLAQVVLPRKLDNKDKMAQVLAGYWKT